jgi:hypothetical protein
MEIHITMKLCYFCYTDGDEVKATHEYDTNHGDQYDVCDKHAETVREVGLDIREIEAINDDEAW